MFKVDMEAVRDAAVEAWLMANPAKLANEASQKPDGLAKFAKLAISQQCSAQLDPVLSDLLEAAMRACDAWQDGHKAREQMRQDCLDTPPHLRADLLGHFVKAYGPSP